MHVVMPATRKCRLARHASVRDTILLHHLGRGPSEGGIQPSWSFARSHSHPNPLRADIAVQWCGHL